jgi:shikimate dehydrogenase
LLRTGSTSAAGILGWPLDHTLSPVIHNAAFRSLGLDWIYLTWPVTPDRLGAAVEGLRVLGVMGANVTMPHKETVLELLDEVSGDARSIGAVNTIQRLGDALIGHNTDVDGFAQFLTKDAGCDPAGKHALVLGSGGAARAVVKALSDLGAAGVTVAAREQARSAELAHLAAAGLRLCAWDDADRHSADSDIIVNATPLGAVGEEVVGHASFTRGQVIVDLVYRPPATRLVERARAAGAEAWGGLGMLLAQAAASFRIWTGQDAPVDVMSAAALRALKSPPG